MRRPRGDRSRPAAELRAANRRFYDPLWSRARLVEPEKFNTWPIISALVGTGQKRLEVAPGLRPRLPLARTVFADLSTPAVEKLRARGAAAVTSAISELPFADATFGLVCALDVVEHVDEEDRALGELARVSAAGATLLISVPLHPERWSRFDDWVGHRRRYEPAALVAKLAEHGLEVERSGAYGMQLPPSRLLDFGMWYLAHRPHQAAWFYSRLFMPIGLRRQKKLVLVPGMIDAAQVDEIFMVCRKRAPRARP